MELFLNSYRNSSVTGGGRDMQLNSEMLVAMRTCLIQSWTNLAERVMSVFNLVLQYVSIELGEIHPTLEGILKQNNSLLVFREVETK